MSIFQSRATAPMASKTNETLRPLPLAGSRGSSQPPTEPPGQRLSPPGEPPREPPCPGIFQPAGTYDRPDLLIDDALQREVILHLGVNIARLPDAVRTLYLTGPPGEGKTIQARAAISRAKFGCAVIAGSHFSGPEEGAPIAKFDALETWIRNKTAQPGHERIACILDDMDTSAADERPGVERTVNSGLLCGRLQFIATTPESFTAADGTPVPLIWTTNVNHFRAPLIRAGRCRIHHHAPTWQQKAAALAHLLKPPTECAKRRLRALVWKHKTQSLAWWTQLIADQRLDVIAAVIEEYGLDPDRIKAAAHTAEELDVRLLHRLAKQRRQAADNSPVERI